MTAMAQAYCLIIMACLAAVACSASVQVGVRGDLQHSSIVRKATPEVKKVAAPKIATEKAAVEKASKVVAEKAKAKAGKHAAEKAVAVKPATAKTVSKNAEVKKAPAEKNLATEKVAVAAAAKAAVKKVAAEKAAAEAKIVAEKAAAAKLAAKKVASGKAATAKAVAKKGETQKTATAKAAVKKAVAKVAASKAEQDAVEKATTGKQAARKKPIDVKTVAGKKAADTKVAAEKAPNLLATGSGASSRLGTWQHALKADPHLFEGCKSIFLDVGSNRGTHVRKLFEPQKYPGCPYLSVFEKGFGAPEARSKPFSDSGICAFGFEANPRWASTLQEVERAYNAKGWRVKWFAPEAVSNSTGTLPFYKNDAGANSDWAFSMRKTVANSEEVRVPEVDLSAFIETMHKAAPAGFRLMKMDIESAEFVVLPPFLTKQLLCKNVLDTITIEWHDRFLKSDASKKQAAELESKVNSPEKCASGAATTITKFDDESYRDDGMPLP